MGNSPRRVGKRCTSEWCTGQLLAELQDLYFHDLRNTFTTRLQNLGVSLEIRSALLGHSTEAVMTSQYSHGGLGWKLKLRDAVTQLETTYTTPILSYGLSYEALDIVRPDLKRSPTMQKIRWKVGGPNEI